ncbi:NADH dehydrogenase subunit E [Roseovarius tolerans]|uniref:NADH dehydrogenase subunit E n=1 Tax=Roseovarius tolerans TaxID=74031 RepID=A0A0L6CRS1_9RHOB|nr:NADH:ubiquinone oxidoreductase [Roseovarius tolerans]KNX40375.1 NADH dehydrogenase subunit E [Roseovarius tolerans]
MSDTSKLSTCQIVCWCLAGLTGILVLWSASGAVGFFAALLLGAAFAAFVGLAITRLVCTGYGDGDAGIKTSDLKETVRQVTGITGYKAPFDEDEDHVPAAPKAAPAKSAAKTETADAPVKSGTVLDGEKELAARKGDWKYGDEAQTAAPAATDEDDVGTRPEALSAPKGGQADDLKQIKGVGPKLEKLCNELGFYHFDQIAGCGPDEVAWVDANIKGFKGRVSRDNWVAQAKTLAAGGETEFSKRVEGGNVY